MNNGALISLKANDKIKQNKPGIKSNKLTQLFLTAQNNVFLETKKNH